jgi:hypothetical protein
MDLYEAYLQLNPNITQNIKNKNKIKSDIVVVYNKENKS